MPHAAPTEVLEAFTQEWTNSMHAVQSAGRVGRPSRTFQILLSIGYLTRANSSVLWCLRARPPAPTQLASLRRATPTLSRKLLER